MSKTENIIFSLKNSVSQETESDQKAINAACEKLQAFEAENEQLKTALGKALDNGTFKPHIKSILDFHRQEYPTQSNHWLSGFLNAYCEQLGEDDAFGVPLRQRQLEQENEFFKVQIRELREKIEIISGNPF